MIITKEVFEIEEILNKKINNNTYLFFKGCENVFINTLEQIISIIELENYIKIP